MGYVHLESVVTFGMIPTREWVLERWSGGGAALHKRPVPIDGRRRLSILEFDEPAFVLGSRSLDPGLNQQTVRRRSGGGIVLLDPEESTWIDVTLPRNDPLWSDDLNHSFRWLGETIASAFVGLGLEARTHEGKLLGDDTWCFDAVGAGEVLWCNRKLVGISQRRTRQAARFQCVWYRHFHEPPGFTSDNSRGVGWADAGLASSAPAVLDSVLSAVIEV